MPKYISNSGQEHIGNDLNPLAKAWKSSSVIPTVTARDDGRFISWRIYNYVYNDVAEQMPSDGSLKPKDIAMVDIDSDTFRVCKWDGKKLNQVI